MINRFREFYHENSGLVILVGIMLANAGLLQESKREQFSCDSGVKADCHDIFPTNVVINWGQPIQYAELAGGIFVTFLGINYGTDYLFKKYDVKRRWKEWRN